MMAPVVANEVSLSLEANASPTITTASSTKLLTSSTFSTVVAMLTVSPAVRSLLTEPVTSPVRLIVTSPESSVAVAAF